MGLLARHILGSSYKILPFKKSRYYSHKIPIADNEIVTSEGAQSVLKNLHLPTEAQFFPTAISYSGQLMFNKFVWAQVIVDRLYSEHHFAAQLLGQDVTAYKISAKQLYDVLVSEYVHEFQDHIDTEVLEIRNNTIKTTKGEIEYDNIVSTIPLDALLKIMGIKHFLEAKDYHVFLVATDAFDLESAKRCYIGDLSIPFWKVNTLDRELYQFFANGYVENADVVFSLMTKRRFRVLADTVVKNAFPLGMPPTTIYDKLKEHNITCIGSNARWDYFSDISTSINTILKL